MHDEFANRLNGEAVAFRTLRQSNRQRTRSIGDVEAQPQRNGHEEKGGNSNDSESDPLGEQNRGEPGLVVPEDINPHSSKGHECGNQSEKNTYSNDEGGTLSKRSGNSHGMNSLC